MENPYNNLAWLKSKGAEQKRRVERDGSAVKNFTLSSAGS